MAPTLADLPTDVAATPPDLIFLQNRVSGLSAEILSRHIRNQLSNVEKITIVVLTESAGDAPDETALETAVSDEEFLAAVRQVITGSKKGMRELPPASAPEPAAPEAEAAAPATAPTAGPDDTAPGDIGSPGDFDIVSLGGRTADGTDETGTPVQTQPLNFLEELESLTGPPRAETVSGRTSSPFPESAPTIDGSRTKMRWWGGVAISVIAAGTVLFLSTRGTPPPLVPLQQQAAPETPAAGIGDKAALPERGAELKGASPDIPALPEHSSPAASAAIKGTGKTSLPRFIPPQSIVPGYGKNNPGWEQYVTPELEFRIYRKGRDIDALQVIDRTGKGMSRSFFTRTILEMAEVRDYRLQSKEIKGDYLIKRGTLTANAGVILYKKRDDTQLKAFVIHYQ